MLKLLNYSNIICKGGLNIMNNKTEHYEAICGCNGWRTEFEATDDVALVIRLGGVLPNEMTKLTRVWLEHRIATGCTHPIVINKFVLAFAQYYTTIKFPNYPEHS